MSRSCCGISKKGFQWPGFQVPKETSQNVTFGSGFAAPPFIHSSPKASRLSQNGFAAIAELVRTIPGLPKQ
jgi:hypothetical protein